MHRIFVSIKSLDNSQIRHWLSNDLPLQLKIDNYGLISCSKFLISFYIRHTLSAYILDRELQIHR